MKKHTFNLATDEDIILLPTRINGYEVQLALDTTATQTIIDFNVLLMLGYKAADFSGTNTLETANGVLEANIYQLNSLEVLGYRRTNFPIFSYDFLQKGILSTYDGVLGLDFFRGQGCLTIDFKEQVLWFY